MTKHLTDQELQAEIVAADMFQTEVLLNDGERNAALWQTIPDTLRRFIDHDHAPETVDTLELVNTACAALAKSARVMDVYRGVAASHLKRLAREPHASAAAAGAHRAVAQYAAALRAASEDTDALTRALTHHRTALATTRGERSTDAA